MDSSGPDVRIRGNAQQIQEKYTALSEQAKGEKDRTLSENYRQHAYHYSTLTRERKPDELSTHQD